MGLLETDDEARSMTTAKAVPPGTLSHLGWNQAA
jgi:hypothetical protein